MEQAKAAIVPLLFQSTPDLINRENELFAIKQVGGKRFQSTPDLINRENASSHIGR